MSAESFKTPQSGETIQPNGFVLLPERQNKVRETISFNNLGERSTKYNSPGVDPENPYNAFAPVGESKNLTPENNADLEGQPENSELSEAQVGVMEEMVGELEQLRMSNESLESKINELEKQLATREGAKKELAEKQPRRVRHENGVTERLVKFTDGSFAWEVIGEDNDSSVTNEKSQPDKSVQPEQMPIEKSGQNETERKQEKPGESFSVGDAVLYKNVHGETVEGIIVDDITQEDDDFKIFSVQTPNGNKPVGASRLNKILPVIPGEEGSEVPAKEGQSLEEYEAEHASDAEPEVDTDTTRSADELDKLFKFESANDTSDQEITPKEKLSLKARMLSGFLAGSASVKKLWESRPLRRRREAGKTPEEKQGLGARTWVRLGVGTAALVLVAGLSSDATGQMEQAPQPAKKIEITTPGLQDDILDGKITLGQELTDENER